MKTHLIRNLKIRLIVSIGLVAALGALTMTLVAYVQIRNYQITLWENILRDSVENTRSDISQWLSHQRRQAEQTALHPAIRQNVDQLSAFAPETSIWQTAYQEVHTRLDVLQENTPYLLEVAILSPADGQVLLSTTRQHEGIFFSHPEVHARARTGTYISPLLRDARQQALIFIATPIYNSLGKQVGILVFSLDGSQLPRLFHNELLNLENGHILLIDRNRLPLTETTPLYTSGANLALQGKTGLSAYLNGNSIKVLGAYTYLPVLQAGLLIEIPYHLIMQRANQTGLVLLFSGLALIGGLIALGTLGGQMLFAPLQTLVKGMQAVAAGDLHTRIPVKSEDEIGLLTQRFNQMVSELETLYRELEEQKRSYLLLFDEAPDGIVLLSSDQKIQNANRGWFDMLQTDAVGQVFQQPIAHFFQVAKKDWETILSEGQLRLRGHLRRPKGESLPVDVRCKVISSGSIQMIFTDVSDQYHLEHLMRQQQIQLERQVQQRTAELQQANRELEAFTYSVSHDLRAPLRAIIGYLNIFLETNSKALTPQGKALLDKVQSSAHRLADLIQHLLTISRLGRAAMRLQPITSDELKTMIDGIIQDLRLETPAYERATIQLRPLRACQADPTLLRQVFQNLISNAFKFSAHQPRPKIEIGSFDGLNGPGYYVRDNGVGFNPAYADKLFAPFQRLHGQDFPGYGAGLAIVQRIIRRHGGSIWAESSPGEGAIFYFTIVGENKS